jgi:hypothetical protein
MFGKIALQRKHTDFHDTLQISSGGALPSPNGQVLAFRHGTDGAADHGFAEISADFSNNPRITEVGCGLDNGLGTAFGVSGFENAGADKNAIHTQLHHERRIRRRGDAACRKIDDRQMPQLLGFFK